MKGNEFFSKRPVFTHDEFAAVLSKRGERSRRTVDSLLAYHVGAGHLINIRRGLYAVVPLGVDPDTCPVDPYLLAGKMAPDAVLSHHTALGLHGKSYSVFNRFFFLTAHAVRPLSFRGHEFVSIHNPKALNTSHKRRYGTQEVERAGLPIHVTTLERTLADVLDRPDLCGGWEEVWRSLEMVEFFNLDQVVAYTLFHHKAVLCAKVGFFLAQHREPLMVEESTLRKLRANRPRQAHYLDRSFSGRNKLVSEWNLIVPESILSRSWEEPQ